MSKAVGRESGRRGRKAAPHVEAVMRAAERLGLLDGKSRRIGAGVSAALVAEAKRQTGIDNDTDLLQFALASIALEEAFAEAFRAARGKVDEDLDLGGST